MFDISKLYISACSNSVQLVPLHSIIISILFHHYKELKDASLQWSRWGLVEPLTIAAVRNRLVGGKAEGERSKRTRTRTKVREASSALHLLFVVMRYHGL